MPFSNPIVGGRANLIREAIRSPNYVPGLTGWSINRDGSAEFQNVTLRGSFVSVEEIDLRLATPFTEAILVTAQGDNNARWLLRADGFMEWGDGGPGPRDTQLERLSAGLLWTPNSFRVGTNFTVDGDAVVGDDLAVTGDATVGATLGVTGLATLGALAVTANATVGGTLGVTGLATLGTLNATTVTVSGTLTARGVEAGAARSSDLNRINTTAVTADPVMQLPVAANTVYLYRAALALDADAAADMVIGHSGPAGATLANWRITTQGTGGIWTDTRANLAATLLLSTNGAVQTCLIEGTLRIGGTAGTFALLWGPNANTPNNCTMMDGSSISLTPIA